MRVLFWVILVVGGLVLGVGFSALVAWLAPMMHPLMGAPLALLFLVLLVLAGRFADWLERKFEE